MSGPSCTSQDASITPTAFDKLPWRLRAVYSVRRTLARRLAAIRLHRLSPLPDNFQRGYCKQRTRWAQFLIPPGNLYLRVQGALSEVLARQDWIAWEAAIATQLKRDVRILEDHSGLEIPDLSGACLQDLLRAAGSVEDKLRGIYLSACALQQFHRICVTNGRFTNWPLSHGDATARNVIVDLETNTANWIDFDMRHRPGLAPVTRRADDLRTLMWSSANWLDQSECRDVICAASEGYADAEVVRELQGLTRRWTCPTVFQLAQSPMSITNFADFRATLCNIVF